MVVQYFDFGRYHGKQDIQGSTFIRMKQMQAHWPEFSPYKYGAKPDALIFQKVYITQDYVFPRAFEGIKILDICDPDWLEGININETCMSMDAVTVPTEPLAEYMRQFHDNVVVIPDRFDTSNLPKPKEHTEPAKTVVWFGYSHNAMLLKQAMNTLDELDLNLLIIANDDPFLHQWSQRKHYFQEWYKFKKYNEATFYEDIQHADMAIMPPGIRPIDVFKSNNKTIKANLAGLPVAVTREDVERYLDPGNRQSWHKQNYDIIKSEYDIRKSVEQYKAIIEKL